MRGLLPDLPRKACIVLGGDLLSAIGSGLTLPFFVVYLHRVRGIELEIAGTAAATIALASLVGNPTAGMSVDRIGARKTLLVGLVVAAAGTGAIAFVETPWEAFAAAATSGFGLAVIWPSLDSLLAVAVRPDQRSSVFAVRHATMNAGFGIGGLVAASVVDFESTASFQLLYLLNGASFLAFTPFLFALRGLGDRTELEPIGGSSGYRSVLGDRVFLRIVGLTALLCTVGYAQLNTAFAVFATGPGEISAGALGLVFAANTLAVALFQLPVLRLAQGRRRTAALVLVFAFFAATWAVTLAAGELGGGAAAVAVFVSAAVIFALGETLMSPSVAPMVNDLAPDRLRGRYNGLYTLAWTTGFIVGPLVAGAALAAGQATLFFLALIGACGLGALGAYRLRPRLPEGVDLVGPLRTEPAAPEPGAVPGALAHD
jgi:MFS family permease